MEDIKKNGYTLIPGRYVGAEDELVEGLPFEEKFEALKEKLKFQFESGSILKAKIMKAINKFNSND